MLLFSCSSEKPLKIEENSKYSIEVSDVLRKYYYDDQSYPLFGRSKSFITKDTSLIVAPDKKNHAIDFYSSKGGEALMSLELDLEGPEGVSKISNVQFKNDTLFIVDAFAYQLVLFDLKGKVIRRIKLIDPEKPFTILPRYFANSEMNVIGEHVYFIGDADLNVSNKKTYKNSKTLISVDLSNGRISYHFGLPDILTENYWVINQYFFSATNVDPNTWVYAYDLSDSIYIYKLNSREVERVHAPSKFHKELPKWNKKDLNSEDAYKYYLSQTSYYKIVYDPYRKYYYRFVNHPNQSAVLEGNLDDMWIRDYSVMVLDSNFNLLTERVFERDEGISQVEVINEDGFWQPLIESGKRDIEGIKTYVKLEIVENEK